MSLVRRWLGRFFVGVVGLGVVSLAATAAWYKGEIVDAPGDHVSRAAIMAIIAQESPVLYRDGSTRIGVFFAEEHREYVPYDEIPEAWVQAITSAEDHRFFDHPGVDVWGISRAMLANVKAGRVVAGGSTLTQQTAKNLYYRPDRSLKSKLQELVNALKLEAHFDKSEILEFYANQFHVSANGRGLAIAARYFFDKPVGELTTLECAFLAGLVKAPAAYNPFVGTTEERRVEARARAKSRTGYVLDRMAAHGHLSAAEHAALRAEEIPFKRGTFRYDSSVLIDEVAARLAQPPFSEVFEALGIDNPSTAGIQVVTTLDADAQREAQYATWHHLSEVGAILDGIEPSALRLPENRAPHPDPDQPVPVHGFSTARVVASAPDRLDLDLGGHACTVDKAGMARMAAALASAKAQAWRRSGDRTVVASALPPGAVTWASLRAPGVCDLEYRPMLQSGLMVLEDGQIRAMVGGNDNRNFNRATEARRQLGSTWKPLVYWAALQLGWTPADLLDNREGVFIFEGTWYTPRPDHEPAAVVSLNQAGVRSENLASIWLLHHMLDDLDAASFRTVAARAGLVPEAVGGREAWIERVRDKYGVIATKQRAGLVAFTAAKHELLAEMPRDPVAEGIPERLELQALHYGIGAEREARKLSGSRAAARRRAVRFNHRRLLGLLPECARGVEKLVRYSADATEAAARRRRMEGIGFGLGSPRPLVAPPLSELAALSVRLVGDDPVLGGGELELACGDAGAGWSPIDAALLVRMGEGEGPAVPGVDALLMDGRLRAATLRRLERVRARRELVIAQQDPYDFDVLQHHPDFRTLVALRYMAALAERLGVQADLPPVMSLPLGAAELTIEEAASLYQGMATGARFEFPGKVQLPSGSEDVPPPESSTLLIAEIRDAEGKVLYSARPRPRQVGDPVAGRLIGDVLRNVVRFGTGRRASRAATIGGSVVPLGGKTGTTNSFRNAAFVGFVPRAGSEGYSWPNGYTIAAYTGFDDNTPMSRGRVRLSGASGALPAWMGTASGMAEHGLLGATAPSEPELRVEGGFTRVPVVDATGRPDLGRAGEVPGSDEKSVLVHGAGLLATGELDASRRVTILSPAGELRPPTTAPWSPPSGGPVQEGGDLPEELDDVDIFIRPEDGLNAPEDGLP